MRVSVAWLLEQLETGDKISADQVADAFVRIGMEVEEVRPLADVSGPLVVGRVVRIEELTDAKKPMRFCKVEVGDADEGLDESERVRGIVCGATNFAEGDLVVVALPGTTLPGGFTITTRKTYGHVSDGMICSPHELGMGTDHGGILVLPPEEAAPGDDAIPVLGMDDTVIELSIGPDRGYCLSVRGLARELACFFDVGYRDPAAVEVPPADGECVPVTIEDPEACQRFAIRRITSVDPTAPTPWWMRRRLLTAGIRSISVAVDVTNYVMLEMGQPMHAFDGPTLQGAITVRRARPGEKLTTLDDVERVLDPDDVVVCDESGPISLAGVMGGASTEVRPDSGDIVLEAAIWDPPSIARAVRRHKLPSEASRRYERAVDPALPPVALERAARLLRDVAEGSIRPGRTDEGTPHELPSITMPIDLPDRVAGVNYARGVTAHRLRQIGCRPEVASGEDATTLVTAHPPSWRPDLEQPADLVEEVLRLEGYDTIPSTLPAAPAGRGLTLVQRRRRTVSRALAEAGYVEVRPFPFVSPTVWDAFGLAADDSRRRTLTLVNPLEQDHAELATTLLPGMLDTLARNVSRGARDLALFHIGQVVQPRAEQLSPPELVVTHRPSDEEIAAMQAALPQQPVHVAAVLAGNRQRAGWWGRGEKAGWADAVQAARIVGEAAGVPLRVRAWELMPWHPGQCAQLLVGDWPVGHAGELHPKVIEALGLPAGTCAMELDLDALPLAEKRLAPRVSPYPPVLLDVALVVDEQVPVAEVAEALRVGGGDLLEDLNLFDVYTGEQIGQGQRSLAFALRLRAPDRTLTLEEATVARDAAVASATQRHGATLR